MRATYQVGDGPFSDTGSTLFGGVGRRLAALLRFFDTGMAVKANTKKPILSNATSSRRGTLWSESEGNR